MCRGALSAGIQDTAAHTHKHTNTLDFMFLGESATVYRNTYPQQTTQLYLALKDLHGTQSSELQPDTT